MKRPDIRIAVLNYNGKTLLQECLPSLMAAAKKYPGKCGVTVVDNRSTDGSLEFLESEYKDRVEVYRAKNNECLISYNDYIKGVKEELIVLLNNDIKTADDFLEPLAACFDKEDIFFAAPKHMSFDGKEYQEGNNRLTVKFAYASAGPVFLGYEKFINTAGYSLYTGNGAFKVSIFNELGGFDRMYLPGYSEDADLCYRAWKAGYKGYYVPQSVIFHKCGETFGKYFNVSREKVFMYRNKFLFLWKNLDAPWLVWHFLMSPVMLLVYVFSGRIMHFFGFFEALKHAGKIKRNKNIWKLSDREISNLIQGHAKRGKILVIKLCCIGDIIQLTPALRALKASGAEVHLLCVEWVKQIAEMVPFIDSVKTVNLKNPFSIISVLSGLRAEKYGIIINFHRDKKSFMFASLTGAKRRAGFIWKGSEKSLTDAFPYDASLHETERYLSVVKGLGFQEKGGWTEISRPQIDNPKCEMPADKIKIGIFPAGGDNPGTKMPTKRWPAEKFNSLIKDLEKAGKKVYVFGASFDRKVMEEAAKGTAAVMIESGLKEFAYYAAGMDLFVACDTGPLHMAAALGVKTIGLYGPSSPEVFGARGKNSLNIWEKESCGPCYQPETVFERKFLECNDNKCMKKISVEKVLDGIEKISGGKI